MAGSSSRAYKVLASEVAIVEAEDDAAAPKATAGHSTFCFDILVAGARLAGFQFQNSACSHIAVLQDRGGSWQQVMPWTPMLLHDYRDDLELEAWHFVPVSMVRSGTHAIAGRKAGALVSPVRALRFCANSFVVLGTQFNGNWEAETMCRLRIYVQYRTTRGVQAHQLRHVRCLREDAAEPSDAATAVDAASAQYAGGDEDPSGMRDKVADRAMLLSELLALGTPRSST